MRRAVTVAPSTMRIETTEPEPLRPNSARIEVEAVGMCGSDFHLYRGQGPYAQFPQVYGHEFAGIVRELADDYRGAVGVGDRVAVEPLVPCGACVACGRGRPNCCAHLQVLGAHIPGALADEIVVDADRMYPVGDLDVDLAALVEPVSIGLQAVTRGQVTAADTVVVLGAGPIGLAATLVATDVGARVLTVDRLTSRLERARTMGAAAVVDTTTTDLAAAVADFTSGQGPTVVIDATGSPELIRSAFDLVAHSGVIVIVGISGGEAQIPVVQFSAKEVTVYGSRNNNGVFGRAVELVRRYPDELRTWITQRVTLDELPGTMEFGADHPESFEKIIVSMRAGAE